MAEQQAAAGTGEQRKTARRAGAATTATPIFDELLREMTAAGSARSTESGGRRAKPVESKHRAP